MKETDKKNTDVIEEHNKNVIWRRHGVKSIEELINRIKKQPDEYMKVEDEVLAGMWININMEKGSKTIMEYIRNVVEYRIRD